MIGFQNISEKSTKEETYFCIQNQKLKTKCCLDMGEFVRFQLIVDY